MDFEWQQVSSSQLDSSQYSGPSQKCSGLDGQQSSFYFQVLLSLYFPLVTLPRAPITIGIIVTFMFHSFFNPRASSTYSFSSFSFNISLWSAGTDVGLCIYLLFVWSNKNLMHNSQGIIMLTQSSLVCANLLHLLNMWLIVSSLSPHKLRLLVCCVLSIFALIWLVLMALFCTAIISDSVPLLSFLFLSLVHVLSCEMLLVSPIKRPQLFSSHFRFLVISVLLILVLSILFLVALSRLSRRFSM